MALILVTRGHLEGSFYEYTSQSNLENQIKAGKNYQKNFKTHKTNAVASSIAPLRENQIYSLDP